MPEENTKTPGTQPGNGAAENPGANQTTQTNEGNGSATETQNEKTSYTSEEVKSLLQKEGDRRVTDAQKKWEKDRSDLQKQIDGLNNDIKLSKLTEAERAKELEKQKQDELANKEKELNEKEVNFETAKYIAEKGLKPDILEQLVNVPDLESRKKIIDTLISISEEKANNKVSSMQRGTYTDPNKTTKTLPDDPRAALDEVFKNAQKK